mgnify:CR=1 FL=1
MEFEPIKADEEDCCRAPDGIRTVQIQGSPKWNHKLCPGACAQHAGSQAKIKELEIFQKVDQMADPTTGNVNTQALLDKLDEVIDAQKAPTKINYKDGTLSKEVGKDASRSR